MRFTRLALLTLLALAAGACTHERFDEWLGPKIGLPEGVCKDGELELFPPRCEPNDHPKTTTSGGTR